MLWHTSVLLLVIVGIPGAAMSATMADPPGGDHHFKVRIGPRADRAGSYVVTSLTPPTERAVPAPADFDGDGQDDPAVYDVPAGNWYILHSSSGVLIQDKWGLGLSVPVPGDYDGDRRADLAVFEQPSAAWYVLGSKTGAIPMRVFGSSTSVPVPGDYDGDGKMDLAVFEPSNFVWRIKESASGVQRELLWGWRDTIPVPGDYDGDGKTDLSVFHVKSGLWLQRLSTTKKLRLLQWGYQGVRPVPARYRGATATDVAVFEPTSARWHVPGRSTMTTQLGYPGVVPAPADYDGDGRADLAVYDPAKHIWYFSRSEHGFGSYSVDLSNQIMTDFRVRRFRGTNETPIRLHAELVEGNASWFSLSLSETNFLLGGQPTACTADTDESERRGDLLGDGDLDDDDVARFESYETGSGQHLEPEAAKLGMRFDLDGDLDVDGDDRLAVMAQYTGPVGTPWDKHLDLKIRVFPTTPEGASASFRIVATDTVSGESHAAIAHVTKKTYGPRLKMRDRSDGRLERTEKLAYGRVVRFDLSLLNEGGASDFNILYADPIPGFSNRFLNLDMQFEHTNLGNKVQNAYVQGPLSSPMPFTLEVTTPEGWMPGAHETITVHARSANGGHVDTLKLGITKAGALYSPSDLTKKTGRHHNVLAGRSTAFRMTLSNLLSIPANLKVTAEPVGDAAGWSASFDKSLVNLATGGQDHVTLRLTAPPGSLPGAVSEWRVCVATALGLPLGVARFGARVTGTPKVIYVAVDGLNKEYLELNRAGTAPGTSGDWLLPNLRNFKERGTWYINARAMMPFVTDPNHIAAVTGCNPGMNGVPGVMMFDMGRKPDGENVARMIDDITPEYLHSGIDGQRVKSIFDVAKAANPNAFTAYVTSKNWMNYFFRNRLTGEGVDRVLTGRVVPPYIEDPPHHVFGDPETDDAATDPYYDVLLHNFGYASGSLPSDAWMFDSTLRMIDTEDPDVIYMILGEVDEITHSFGASWKLDDWDDRGTATTWDDRNLINPVATRDDPLDVLRELDYLWGRFTTNLQQRGMLDSTYVVLVSDHSMVTHHAHLLDPARLLQANGYSNRDDFQMHAASALSVVYDVADSEKAKFEHVLENSPPIVPGVTNNPWIVINRAEMMTGIDAKTGRKFSEPGEIYSPWVAAHGGENRSIQLWPDFVIMADGNWQFALTEYHRGEDVPRNLTFIGGHGGPATKSIPLLIAGPGVPQGVINTNEARVIDIAPTLYHRLGWPAPAYVQGTILPGLE